MGNLRLTNDGALATGQVRAIRDLDLLGNDRQARARSVNQELWKTGSLEIPTFGDMQITSYQYRFNSILT